jgi:hypothetical protein
MAGPAREALFELAIDLDGLANLARSLDERCRRGVVDGGGLEAAMRWLEAMVVDVRASYRRVTEVGGQVRPLARMGGRTRGA